MDERTGGPPAKRARYEERRYPRQFDESIIAVRRQPSRAELEHIKAELIKKDLFFWDRTPPNYEHTNVRALKLFGYATPTTDFSQQPPPSEIERFRNVRPIDTASSAVFKQVGRKLYDSLEAAAAAIAESGGKAVRPPVCTLLVRSDRSLREESILFSPNAVVHAHSVELPFAVRSSEKVDARFTVSDLVTMPSSLPENVFPLFPEPTAKRAVEVLNAFPLVDAPGVRERALKELRECCRAAGFVPQKLYVEEKGYALPRVFVELLNDDQCEMLAEQLGRSKVENRSLVTTVGFART